MDRLTREVKVEVEAEVIEGEMRLQKMPTGLGVAAREVIILVDIRIRWKMRDGTTSMLVQCRVAKYLRDKVL